MVDARPKTSMHAKIWRTYETHETHPNHHRPGRLREPPGIPKEDLEVNLEGQILTLTGRCNFEKEERNEEYFWREREQGRFVRTVRLPSPIDASKVEATYNDGVMTIRLPKSESANRTRVTIR